MPEHRQIALKVAAALAVTLTGACGSRDDATVTILSIGTASSPFEKGVRLSPSAQLVRASTVEGLVAFDEQARVIPALADRWIVTDGGQSYIFRLRDGTWSDGSNITAQSAQAALRRSLAALRGTPFALDVAGIEEIRVMAGRVIEIRLTRPVPDLLQLLAQPELGLAHRGEGAGPMRLRRDVDTAILRPASPKERGLPDIANWNDRVRDIHLAAQTAEKSVAQFNRGEADLLLGGRLETFPLAKSVGISRGTIQLDPVSGLLGLAVVHDDGFLALPENRETIAMAIDRNAMIDRFGVSGWTASTRIVAPGMAGDLGTIGERWAGLAISERQAQAAARVARWRQQHSGPVRLRIALPPGPGSEWLFARLRTDFAAAGIEAVLVAEGKSADLRLLDVVAHYARPSWYLNQLSCAARRGLCSAEADKRAAEARMAPDAASRAALLAEAEAELTTANVFIPFGAPIRWSLVRGDVTGYSANRWNIHPLLPMAMRPK